MITKLCWVRIRRSASWKVFSDNWKPRPIVDGGFVFARCERKLTPFGFGSLKATHAAYVLSCCFVAVRLFAVDWQAAHFFYWRDDAVRKLSSASRKFACPSLTTAYIWSSECQLRKLSHRERTSTRPLRRTSKVERTEWPGNDKLAGLTHTVEK